MSISQLHRGFLASRPTQLMPPSPLTLALPSPLVSRRRYSSAWCPRRSSWQRFPFARLASFCACLIFLRLIYLNGSSLLSLMYDRTEPSTFFRHFQIGDHGVILKPWSWPVAYKLEIGLSKQHNRLQAIPELRRSSPPPSLIGCQIGQDHPLLFIGVFTTAGRTERRALLRKLQKPINDYVNGASVDFKFVLGQPKTEADRAILGEEMRWNNDILLLDENENMNKGKSYAFFRYLATRKGPAPQFAFKLDDDAFMMIDNLVNLLQSLDCSKSFYIGSCTDPTCGLMRGWPFFFTGMAYGLSRPLYTWMGQADLDSRRLRGPEDVRTGRLMYSLPHGEKLIRLNLDGRMGEWRDWRRRELPYDPETVLVVHGMKSESHLKHVRDKLIAALCGCNQAIDIFSTENRFEKLFGYKRAVRKGPFIFVSGTTALDPESGVIKHLGNPYEQSVAAFEEALRAVVALGGTRGDVCRVRMFVRHSSDTSEVGKAFSATFGTRAAADSELSGELAVVATMLIAQFVDEDMLVEVELDAIVL